MKPLIQIFAILVPALAVAAGAADKVEDPISVLRRGVDEVLAVAYDGVGDQNQPLSDRVRGVFAKYFEFETVTKRAVGPAWRKLDKSEQAKITDLFTTLVLRTYVDNFEPVERPEIQFGTAVELSATRQELPTTVVYAGKSYSVSYRVEKTPEGWMIYDVIAERVSMIANYRAQFEAILQKGGASALIESLEENIRNARKT
ncbi:MAG TPA: ABC transporter substrate-binding protein [Opitutaceae bacterium]